jgi:hypothetical protein
MKDGVAPCGHEVDDMRHEKWRQEMTCYLIGCDKCSLHSKDTPLYYISSEDNIKHGLSIWAKYMLGELDYD